MIDYKAIMAQLQKIAAEKLPLLEGKAMLSQLNMTEKNLKKQVKNNPEFLASVKIKKNKLSKFWNLAHNTAVHLFERMPESEMASLKKAVSKDSIAKIDTILQALADYQKIKLT